MPAAREPTRRETSGKEPAQVITEDQSEVAALLADPRTHGEEAGPVERIDTHGAVVFLAGATVYKLKRAVKFPYMDFSTAKKRRAACEAEIETNSRTAPAIYKGVAPIVRTRDGGLALAPLGAAPASAVDWVVVMARFEEAGLFDRLAERNELDDSLMTELAAVIAGFHARAAPRFDHGGKAAIAWVVEENLEAMARDTPSIFDPARNERLRSLSAEALGRHRRLLDRRRDAGFVRHCHGDLHLRNVCLIAGKPTLFDAIEFNEAIACIDVLYDLAFLLMDLERRELRGLANVVFNHYLALSEDGSATVEGLAALPLFLSCRAGIRAQTDAASSASQPDRGEARRYVREARLYQKMAVDLLSPPPPRLIAVGGLSGAGKSTLARRLAPAIGAAPGAFVVRSDVARKRLFGVAPMTRLGPEGYGAPVTARVYRTLNARARLALTAGHAVIADAVFASPRERQAIEGVAKRAGVPFTGLWLEAPVRLMEERLAARRRDASDATPEILRRQLGHRLGAIGWCRIDTSGDIDSVLGAAGANLG